MTSGSTLTHLIVIEPAQPTSDPLVVADARALPEEADQGVALVVARQSLVVLEGVDPAFEKSVQDFALVGRQRGAGRGAQAAQHGHEIGHRDAAPAIDGYQPLAVVHDEMVLAALEGSGQLLDVPLLVAQ